MYAGSGISKTIAMITVIAQFAAMRAVAAPLPGRRASSLRSQTTSSRHVEVLSAGRTVLTMLHPDRHGGSDPHELRRRIVEANPDGKALGDDNPAQRAADHGQSGPVAIVGLHPCADAFDAAADRSLVGPHHPHRRVVVDGE